MKLLNKILNFFKKIFKNKNTKTNNDNYPMW